LKLPSNYLLVDLHENRTDSDTILVTRDHFTEIALSLPGPSTFISYCRDDYEFALRLAADLKAAGAAVWIDQIDIAFGERWDVAVERALLSAPRILVVLSPASAASSNVLDEVSFALSKQKTVIPVLYRDCEIPFRLHRLQHLDFRSSYDRGLKALTEALTDPQQVAAMNFSQPRPRSDEQAQVEQAHLAPDQAESLRLAKEANERAVREQAERDRIAAQQAKAKRLAKKKAADRLARERAAAEAEIRAKGKAAAEAAEADRRAREEFAAGRAEATRIAEDKGVVDFLTGASAAPQSPEEKAEVERRRYELGESIRKSKAARLEKERARSAQPAPQSAPRADEAEHPALFATVAPAASSNTGGGSVKVGGRWRAPANEAKIPPTFSGSSPRSF
jgi:hypothetical protein